MLGNFLFFCCRLLAADFFQTIISMNSITVSNSLDLDLDQHSVGPDLGPNCLHIMSVLIWVQTVCKGYQKMTIDKSCCQRARSSHKPTIMTVSRVM